MDQERYFVDQDSDCHWYLVKASKREQWNRWTDLDSDDPKSWNAPEYAKALGGSPAMITFRDPK